MINYLAFLMLLFGEARGEPIAGQLLVANVALNRKMDVLNYKQFNCFDNKTIKLFKDAENDNDKLIQLTKKVFYTLAFSDLIRWSIWYANKETIQLMDTDESYYYMTIPAYKDCKRKYPRWINSLVKVKTVGNHIFLKDKLTKEN